VRSYFAFLRDRATVKFQEDFEKERFNHAVQIDESLFGRRKYNRGRKARQDWVFGICDSRPGGRVYMQPVLKRDAATLIPIVEAHVDREALIASDEWAAYRQLNRQYFHATVCHKANFVSPMTGIHTQRIESLWASCKNWLRTNKYRDPEYRTQYISEWCWRYNHGNRWEELWKLILN
jgi:transposase-like protein